MESRETRIAAVEEHPQEQAVPPAGSGGLKPVRWAYPVGVSLPLIVLNCGWIANSEMKTGVTEVTISTLFMGVTFLLFLITLFNLLIRRALGPRAALNQPELMVLYTLLSISSVVAGVGNFGFFTPFLTNVFQDANAANGWRSIWYLLPWYIGPRDPAILKGFYEGHSSFLRPAVLAAWAGPLAVWSLFFLVLLWTTLCLAVLVRRRWADEEHLPFPVIALPLEMTREGAPLYASRLMWLGFAFPLCLHSLNTLQSIYPTLPTWPINRVHDLVPGMAYPWTGLDSLPLLLHPCGVGFGYLINTDVLFSLWFFYVAKRVLNLWGVLENWRDPGHGIMGDGVAQFPYTGYQGWGAWLAWSLIAVWLGRGYFRAYLRRAWRGDPHGLDRDEPMSARAAVAGLLLGFLALCVFVWSSGGSLWLPSAFFGLYLLLMLALARLQAETAVLSSYLVWIDPQTMITGALGTSALPRADLVHLSTLSWFNLDYRAAPMPHELQGLVGLERARGRLRPLPGIMMLAAAFAMVAALLWDLQLYYSLGASTGKVNAYRINMGSLPWWTLQGWLQHPKPPDLTALAGTAVGFGVTVLLSALRARFVGFPLSPAAYVLNMSWANDLFWCDMFVAWAVKACILRYGGNTLYRRAFPLFLGLILGDFVTGSAWSIVGALLHLDLYRTFSN